jgi:hypothetical protein
MSTVSKPDSCVFCKQGQMIQRSERIVFRQWTDKGYLTCAAVIPMAICNACAAKTWDEKGEAILNEAVRREYDKLP